MALKIRFIGHSAFELSDGTDTLLIDPFISGNPVATVNTHDMKPTWIALTHGHADHIGDTIPIARRSAATVVASFEICNFLGQEGLEKLEPGNSGGTIRTSFGSVTFTHAFHSSSYEGTYMGMPCGLIISMGGHVFYHLGDTGLFGDLKMYGELYRPEVAAIPVGDRFTMDAQLASRAAEWVGAKIAIPVHYGTFPALAQDASSFRPEGIEVRPMEPGEKFELA